MCGRRSLGSHIAKRVSGVYRYSRAPSPGEAQVGFVEGSGVRSGELVEAVQVPLEGSNGAQGQVVGRDPGDGTVLAAGYEGYGSAQRQERVLHEHWRAQDGAGESFGPDAPLLEEGLLPEFPDVPRERVVGVERRAVDEASDARRTGRPREVHVAPVLHGPRVLAPKPGSQDRIDTGAALHGGRQSVGFGHVVDHRLRPQRAQSDFDPAVGEELEVLATRIEEADIMPELLSRLEQQTVQQAWTLWETFACFARESLEVAPEKLIKALLEPALSGIEDLKERKERLGRRAR
jgi:hypothetical protein